LLVEQVKEKLPVPQKKSLSIVIPISAEQHNLALLIANKLILAGRCTDVFFESSIGKKMKRANQLGAKYVIVIGEEEQQNGTVNIKNMQTGKSESIKQIDAASYVK